MRAVLLLAFFFFCTTLSARAEQSSNAENKSSFFGKIGMTIEKMVHKKTDTTYVGLPRQPWRATMRNRISQIDIRFKSDIDLSKEWGEGNTGNIHWQSRMTTPVTYATGLWVGYRSFGLGFQRELGSRKSTHLAFGLSNNHFTTFLRYRESKIYEMNVDITGDINATPIDLHQQDRLVSPIKSKVFVADGYYFFNGSRFSYNAAYKQSWIQKKSAGSFVVGAMAYFADFNYAHIENAHIISMMNNIGRLKITQGNLGFGYTYNYVPRKGWLINGLLMPMVTVLNHATLYFYKIDDNAENITRNGKESTHRNIDYNIDGRLSVTRNWEKFFINVSGQLNHFYYKDGKTRNHTIDWFTNIALGVRF